MGIDMPIQFFFTFIKKKVFFKEFYLDTDQRLLICEQFEGFCSLVKTPYSVLQID